MDARILMVIFWGPTWLVLICWSIGFRLRARKENIKLSDMVFLGESLIYASSIFVGIGMLWTAIKMARDKTDCVWCVVALN